MSFSDFLKNISNKDFSIDLTGDCIKFTYSNIREYSTVAIELDIEPDETVCAHLAVSSTEEGSSVSHETCFRTKDYAQILDMIESVYVYEEDDESDIMLTNKEIDDEMSLGEVKTELPTEDIDKELGEDPSHSFGQFLDELQILVNKFRNYAE